MSENQSVLMRPRAHRYKRAGMGLRTLGGENGLVYNGDSKKRGESNIVGRTRNERKKTNLGSAEDISYAKKKRERGERDPAEGQRGGGVNLGEKKSQCEPPLTLYTAYPG